MKKNYIAILDFGFSNLKYVSNALAFLGFKYELIKLKRLNNLRGSRIYAGI